MQEPNPEDPLNKDAAEVLQNNRRVFEQNVAKAMRGGYVGQFYFERCLKWYIARYKERVHSRENHYRNGGLKGYRVRVWSTGVGRLPYPVRFAFTRKLSSFVETSDHLKPSTILRFLGQ